MSELFTGLALAAVAGLTFVAYRHPAGYRKLLVIIGQIGIMIFTGVLTFSGMEVITGVSIIEELSRSFPENDLQSIQSHVEQVSKAIERLKILFVWAVAIFSYLLFLLFLPFFGISQGGNLDASDANEKDT